MYNPINFHFSQSILNLYYINILRLLKNGITFKRTLIIITANNLRDAIVINNILLVILIFNRFCSDIPVLSEENFINTF